MEVRVTLHRFDAYAIIHCIYYFHERERERERERESERERKRVREKERERVVPVCRI